MISLKGLKSADSKPLKLPPILSTDHALRALAIGIIASAAFTLSRTFLSSRTVQYSLVLGGAAGLAWHFGLFGSQSSSRGIEALDDVADWVIDPEGKGNALVEDAIMQEYGEYRGILQQPELKILRPPPPKKLSLVEWTAHDAYHLTTQHDRDGEFGALNSHRPSLNSA